MARTMIGVGDAKAVQRWAASLAVDVGRKAYFTTKFMGEGETSKMPIQRLTDLQSAAGEKINFDLIMQLKQQPTEGDTLLEGREENLKFYSDALYIDQMRGAVSAGGRMTRKRTLHDLRQVARARASDWWARAFDELLFMYLSGTRGGNTEYLFPSTYTGFAGNAFTAPDSYHYIVSGSKTFATLTTSDTLSLSDIDKAVALASMMGGGSQEQPALQPMSFEGEETYVLVMSPFQEYSIRTNTNSGQWLDVQKALTTAIGKNSQIFKGGLGLYNGVVLHKHKAVVRQYTAGSGGNVEAHRALFLGCQAAVIAFGSPGAGLRFNWVEKAMDYDNEVNIATDTICGIKKSTFNGLDFGVVAIDSAAKQPY